MNAAEPPAGIDVERVGAWMAAYVGLAPPLEYTRLKGGHSNLTYRVDDSAGRSVVLRRPPLGHLLPTAHDMGREYRLISGMWPTSVPVAEPLAFCSDDDVTGAAFYVMSFVDGHVMHDAGVALRHFGEAERRTAGEHFVDVLVYMHDVDPDDAGLGDLGRKEGYVARQLKRWHRQWTQSKTRELRVVDEVHDRLAAGVPEQGPARVVHGDYRLGNCITEPDGKIAAVLDWEIATLGDPLADLGYVVSQWTGQPDAGPIGAPSNAPGFPSRDELVQRYAKGSGRDLTQIDYYVAFSHWKSACIVEGVYARYLGGALDTTGVDLPGFKLRVERSAELARGALDQLA